MSLLLVNGLRVRARVGCQDSERGHTQMLKLDLRIHYDMREAIAHDDIGHALDYKGVASCVRELLGSREWRLLETLAHDVALQLRGLSDKISRVEAAISKDVISDAASVTAIVEVTADNL